MGAISVVDRDGIIRHSTRSDSIGQSRADSYIVRQAFSAPDDDLIVGTPFRAVVEPYTLLIPIARRATDTAGTVNGVVVASFVPSDLRRFFESVNVGAGGTIWVFHRDGTVMFRAPSVSNAMGEPAADNPMFVAAAGRGSGTSGVRPRPVAPRW